MNWHLICAQLPNRLTATDRYTTELCASWCIIDNFPDWPLSNLGKYTEHCIKHHFGDTTVAAMTRCNMTPREINNGGVLLSHICFSFQFQLLPFLRYIFNVPIVFYYTSYRTRLYIAPTMQLMCICCRRGTNFMKIIHLIFLTTIFFLIYSSR